MIVEHNYELMDYILLHQVGLPIYEIKRNLKSPIKELQYNKYISKSIYYINNFNVCVKNNLKIDKIYFELFLYDFKIMNKKKN